MSTQDRDSVLTTTRLGTKQSLTPEGFLFIEDVPIKRTGEMLYGPGETPISVGRDGLARVTRDSVALFADRTIQSYNGKAVVNDHPPEDVTPANWKQYARGVCMNARRGAGADQDVMLADLLITDAATIRDVQAGKREVSAGYEADYEQTGEGTGRQTNIIGNHIALVDKGRCGPRCSIGDHQPTSLKELHNMPTPTKRRRIKDSVLLAVRKTFRDAEEAALEQLGNSGLADGEGMGGENDEEDAGHTHIHIHAGGAQEGGGEAPAAAAAGAPDSSADPVEARFQAIEQALAQIQQLLQGGGEQAPPPDGNKENVPTEDESGPINTMPSGIPDGPGGDDNAGNDDGGPAGFKTGDSASLATSYKALVSAAEVLVPGYRFPTFDAALPRKVTVDAMCGQRRRILDTLYSTVDGKALVDEVNGGPINLRSLDCAQAASLFNSTAAAKRLLNNRAGAHDAHRPGPPPKRGVTSLADLNAANRAYWLAQSTARQQ